MREIKFKAYYKGILERVPLKIKSLVWELTPNYVLENIYTTHAIYAHCAAEEVDLVQYTGLKDCEGKEIYEGDIVECVAPVSVPRISTVCFMRGYFCVIDKYNETVPVSYLCRPRVIGNKFENPELLEGNE